jgi:sugar phosphate isomerase/epimerase
MNGRDPAGNPPEGTGTLPVLSLPSETAWEARFQLVPPETLLKALPREAGRLRDLGAGLVEFPGDLCGMGGDYASPEFWSRVSEVLACEGLGATVHLPFGWVDLASLDGEVWEGSVRSVERAMAALTPLSPLMASVHPANYPTRALLGMAPEKAKAGLHAAFGERIVKALTRLARGALGPVLALENLEGVPPELFAAIVDAAGVKACLDVGHAVADGQDPCRLLELFGGKVLGLHLHDAAPPTGRTDAEGLTHERAHRALGEGRLDLQNLVRAILARDFSGPVVLEVLGDQEPSVRLWSAVLRAAGTGRPEEGPASGT